MRGHIHRRRRKDGSPGRWVAVVDIPPKEGGRRQISATFDSRRQAECWVAEMVARRPVMGGPTVGDFLNGWLEGRQALRPSTRRSYHDHIHGHLVPVLGDVPLASLRPEDIETAYGVIREKAQADDRPLSPSTMRRIHATLHAALETAVKRGLVERNVADTVELAPPVSRPMNVWTPEQAATFLMSVRDDPLYPLWLLATLRGLRRGELLGLKWEDCDLTKRTLTVRRQLVLVGSEVIEGEPKSRAGSRTLALDGGTVTVLRRHRLQQAKQRLRSPNWTVSGLMFTGPTGEALNPAWISRKFSILTFQAGLPRIRFHDLRHLSASLGLEAGESLKEVQARLGHSSIGVTADVYSHISRGLSHRSAQRVADLLDHHSRGLGARA